MILKDFLDPLWKLLKDKYSTTDYKGAGTFNGDDAMQMLVGELKISRIDERANLRDGNEEDDIAGPPGLLRLFSDKSRCLEDSGLNLS